MRQWSRRTVLCVKTTIHTNIESRGILQTSRLSESDEDIFICPTPSKTQINKHNFEIGIFLYHLDTLKSDQAENFFRLWLLNKWVTLDFNYLKPGTIQQLSNNIIDDAIRYIKNLLQTSKSDEVEATYWLPTLRSRRKKNEHPPIQTGYLSKLREMENITPQDETEFPAQFLSFTTGCLQHHNLTTSTFSKHH